MTATAATPLRNEVGLGLLLMVLSVLISPISDIFAKLAVTSVPATEITFVRLVFQMAVLGPVSLLRGTLLDVTWRKMGLHAARGLLLSITMIAFFTPLAVMPVADAIAIFFVEPIILTILGALILKEKVGWRRYTACGVGFLGSLLVIRPSLQDVGPIAFLPVVAALSLALFFLLTRLVAQKEDPWSMQFYAGLWGAVFSGLMLAAGGGLGVGFLTPVMPDLQNTLHIAGAAVAATIAGVLGVYAYRAAPASVLAPLQYLEIVSATILGWWVFGHLPDALKWLGIAIIVASGLYVIWRERQASSQSEPS